MKYEIQLDVAYKKQNKNVSKQKEWKKNSEKNTK